MNRTASAEVDDATNDRLLAKAQARLEQVRQSAKAEASTGTTMRAEGAVEPVGCVCLGCGAEFTVPMVMLPPKREGDPARPVGVPPQRCSTCTAADREKEALQLSREAKQEEERSQVARRKQVLEALEAMGANPWVYNTHTIETLEAYPGREKALIATRDWTQRVREVIDQYQSVRGLYLVGPTGTAKTELAHCAMKALIEAGLQPNSELVYDDALSLIERIQGTYGSDERTWDLLAVRIRAKVWILDDFGTEKPSPDVVRKLTLIFNRREGRPNLVTSNLHPRELPNRNEDFYRLLSRFGTARYEVVKCDGADARFRRAAEAG